MNLPHLRVFTLKYFVFCTVAIRRRFTVIFCANGMDVGVLYHHIVIFALDSASMQSSSFFLFERLPNANFKFIILANTRLWDKQTYISSDSTSSAGWKSDICYKTFGFVRRKVIVFGENKNVSLVEWILVWIGLFFLLHARCTWTIARISNS